jgi:predicted RNA-binding Zn ribbon-like protein
MSHKRQEAPGRLELVREFVNTLDLEDHEEELGNPKQLEAWMRGHELLERGAKVGEGDVEHAQEVREALRALLKANNGFDREPAAIETLHDAADRAAVALTFDPDGSQLAPAAPGVDGALGRLLTIVHEAEHDGTWQRLKACPWHTCYYAFYDNTKNASGVWCTMEVCGNRAKAKAYRERQARSVHQAH